MWPWGHAAVGYLLYSGFERLETRRPPAGPAALLVACLPVDEHRRRSEATEGSSDRRSEGDREAQEAGEDEAFAVLCGPHWLKR